MPQPELIAHRGANRECPENTLAAFRRAVALGADGVELDVHRTTDGVLVVHHDAVPHEAPVPELAGRPLHELSSAQVAAFRVRGEPIPTLAQVLDAVGGAVTVYCELKGPGTAEGGCALLAAHGARHAVHAFDHRQIAAARAIAPSLPRGVLEVSYHLDPLAGAASVGARDIWQDCTMIDAELVRAAHAARMRVIAWTVDTPDDIAALAALGVDALCTNDVALARQVPRR